MPYRLRKPLRVPQGRRSLEIVQDPLYNKGTSFEYGERDRLGLRGLIPPAYLSMEQQLKKIMATLRALEDDLTKHTFLQDLNDRNATLFHRALVRHTEELAPLVYTPTVGRACQLFAAAYRRPRGMYFTALDVGHMSAMAANWPMKEVSVIVVTDGSRVLGLGDLGASSMGIPVGKLALYCAAGGIAPHRVLPVVLDVGTNNQELLNDEFYLGLRQPRLSGDEYFAVVDEFVQAVVSRWPDVLIQFEDFASDVAQAILSRYRGNKLCFNDDIQGTGATVVAGALASMRQLGKPPTALKDHRIVVCGAGSAGIGVATALRDAMARMASPEPSPDDIRRATKNIFVLDQNGLIAGSDSSLTDAQRSFGEDFDVPGLTRGTSLLEVIEKAKPVMLLGLTAVPNLFTEDIITAMARHCDRPIIMPLSNPTSRAECSAADAYKWTDGRAIFASGSPFDPVTFQGKTFTPSQANNMFLFPGVGLGATIAKARVVSDAMFYQGALACADALTDEELANGQVFASVSRIRDVSHKVAVAVVQSAIDDKLNRFDFDDVNDIPSFVDRKMYYPYYVPLFQNPYD